MQVCNTCKNINQDDFIEIQINDTIYQTQCTNCCEINKTFKVYNLVDSDNNFECCVCMEYVNNIDIFTCCHWVCHKCYININKSKCPLCTSKIFEVNNMDIHNIIIPKWYLNNSNKKIFIELAQLLYDCDKITHYNIPFMTIFDEYYKFLLLLSVNDNNNKSIAEKLLPSDIINIVWSTHILDTISYKKLCKTTGSKIIYYYPYDYKYDNLQFVTQRYDLTRELYNIHFESMDKHYDSFTSKNIWHYSNVIPVLEIVENDIEEKIIEK
jgi:hypothetical protein